MLHAVRSISCLLLFKGNLHPLAGTQVPTSCISHILSAASLVVQTPSNIFWTFAKTSLHDFWTFGACFLVFLLFQINSQLLLGIYEDELLPQAPSWLCHWASLPSWYFYQPYMLNCPSNRHHFLLSNEHKAAFLTAAILTQVLVMSRQHLQLKKKKKLRIQNHAPYAAEKPSMLGRIGMFLTYKEPQCFISLMQCF